MSGTCLVSGIMYLCKMSRDVDEFVATAVHPASESLG